MNILHEWFGINKWGDISLVFITQYNINTFLFFMYHYFIPIIIIIHIMSLGIIYK